MTAAHRHPFDLLVSRATDDWRLAEAALLFAMDHCPELRIARYLGRLDAMAQRVDRLNARNAADRIAALRAVLVDEEKLEGDREQYFDPRNSLLNEVLDRRRGLPIALSVIWIDVAQQLKWKLSGVGLPGHFIVAMRSSRKELLADPFHGGRTLSRPDCESLLAAMHQQPIELGDEHFEDWPPRSILARMLHNLHHVLSDQEDWMRDSRVLDRLLAISPRDASLKAARSDVRRRLTECN